MNNQFENRLRNAVTQYKDLIRQPKPLCLPNVAAKRKTGIKKTVAIGLSAAVLVALLAGMAVNYYWFGGFQPFHRAQGQGYVSVVDIKQTKNKISVKVKALVCDQLNTYMRIQLSGAPLGTPANKSNGKWAIDKIGAVTIQDHSGAAYDYVKQTIDYQSDSVTFIENAILGVEKLEDDEAVLVFQGSPKQDTTLNVSVKIMDAHFEFTNIKVNVPPLVKRDLSDRNIVLELPGAQGKVQGVTCTALQTILTVGWQMEDDVFFNSWEAFDRQYDIYLASGDQETKCSIQPPSLAHGKALTENYSVFLQADSSLPLEIRLYEQAHAQPRGKLVKTLAAIPLADVE